MRADKFFTEKFGSRTKAHNALERGLVLRDGRPLAPKDEVREGDVFIFAEESAQFVSEGGFKLERALESFPYEVQGKVFADLGASTGGFTDCLIQHGAKRVYCVDVGTSQLDPRLKETGKIVVMDDTNARFLTEESFPEPIDGIVSDLSFISLRLVLPSICKILPSGGSALVLFKPQFECGGKGLGKSGILPVRLHGDLLGEFYEFCVCLGLAPCGIVNAPLRPKKNVEYVVWLTKGGNSVPKESFLRKAQKNFSEKE